MMEGNENSDQTTSRREAEEQLNRLEQDLAKISARESNFLLIGAIAMLAFIFSVKPLGVDAIAVIVTIPVVVFGGLAYLVYRHLDNKKQLLIKHGLQCQHCGFLPKASQALTAFRSGHCSRCHKPLKI